MIFFLPGTLVVWRKKELRVSIGIQASTTFVLQTFGAIGLLLHLVP